MVKNNIVLTKLVGGLGNQLFQYAAARRLSLLHNVPLKLDISAFRNYKLFKYELDHFSINAEIASADEIEAFNKENSRFNRLARKMLPSLKKSGYITERYFHFDPTVLDLVPPAYLAGYWQSQKYFMDQADTIRNEFKLKQSLIGKNKAICSQISSQNSVIVHVRRGDYVANETTNKHHGTCSIDYYERAARALSKKIKNLHFFVFSDDPDWTKENINLGPKTTYVSHNGALAAHEDLRLMSKGKYFIIANSTFSWWGAWLASSPDKIVIAPKRWFGDVDRNAKDIVPEGWMRL